MKKKKPGLIKRLAVIAVVLAALVPGTVARQSVARAASLDCTLLNDTFSGSLGDEWRIEPMGAGSIGVTGGALRLNNPTQDEYLTTAGSISVLADGVHDDYVRLEFTLKIDTLDDDRAFSVAFGIVDGAHNAATEGIWSLYFQNKAEGQIEFGLRKALGDDSYLYADNTKTIGRTLFNDYVPVTLTGKLNGRPTVTVAGVACSPAADEKITVDGRFAFQVTGGSGSADVRIDDVRIINRVDKTPPVVTDLIENFHGALSSTDYKVNSAGDGFKAGTGGGVYVKDGGLVFDNAAHGAYFWPQHLYGEFACRFDITDIARTTLWEGMDEGAPLTAQSMTRPCMRAPIGFALNLPAGDSWFTSGDFLYITPSPSYIRGTTDTTTSGASADDKPDLTSPSRIQFECFCGGGHGAKSALLRHNLLDPALEGKTVVLQIVAADNRLQVSYYVKGEESVEMLNTPVLTADNYFHYGYTGITTTTDPYYINTSGQAAGSYSAAYFTVRNFSLKNVDPNAIYADRTETTDDGDRQDAYDEGFAAGTDSGFTDGYYAGRQAGYEAGLADGRTDPTAAAPDDGRAVTPLTIVFIILAAAAFAGMGVLLFLYLKRGKKV